MPTPNESDPDDLPYFLRNAKQEFGEPLCLDEVEEGVWWSYSDATGNECPLPTESASSFFKWVLSQVILGHYELREDDNGDKTSLLLGRELAGYSSKKEALTESFKRLLRLKYARLAIRAKVVGDVGKEDARKWLGRELGTKPARAIIELARADEIATALGSFAKRLIDLNAPQSLRLPRNVAALLEEAAECYLHRYFMAAVAVCRSALETALDDRLQNAGLLEPFESEIENAPTAGKKTDRRLWRLINFLTAREGLGRNFQEAAHFVRKKSSEAIHGETLVSGPFAGEIVYRTRSLMSVLFPPSTGG